MFNNLLFLQTRPCIPILHFSEHYYTVFRPMTPELIAINKNDDNINHHVPLIYCSESNSVHVNITWFNFKRRNYLTIVQPPYD